VYFIDQLHIIERSHGFERNGFKTNPGEKPHRIFKDL